MDFYAQNKSRTPFMLQREQWHFIGKAYIKPGLKIYFNHEPRLIGIKKLSKEEITFFVVSSESLTPIHLPKSIKK